MNEIELFGIDGSNLLAFMASVGTMRVLTEAWPGQDVRMSWRRSGIWRPLLHFRQRTTQDDVLDALNEKLRMLGEKAQVQQLTLGKDLSVSPEEFAGHVRQAASSASPTDRTWPDWIMAFGSEALAAGNKIQDTAFRTMSGAGRQHFIESMRTLMTATTKGHLRDALFEVWRYEDEGPAMRWDPFDDRRYAFRADNPSGSKEYPIVTVRGANRLAIEAIPLFPTAPMRGRLATAAFRDKRVLWPIWTPAISLTTLASLLVQRDLAAMETTGVAEVFSSLRLTIQKMRCFSPAVACLKEMSQ